MKKLETKSCEEIMSTAYKPVKFVIDELMGEGLYILAGAPKIGKSWLALDICLSVAKGEKVLMHDTLQSTALYLCLEDSYQRIQNRLYELTDQPTDNLHFAIMSESLGNGLEIQIKKFKSEHSDLTLVVIDTLQMIRQETDCGYGSDYKELSILKNLADDLEITILLVHHTRKCADKDPFNMISGTTGISGCVDGSMVLVETERGSRSARLYCVGRDIENVEMNVIFENYRWNTSDDVQSKPPDIFSFAIHDFMVEKLSFSGSATKLCDLLYQKFNQVYFPNRLSRDLIQHTDELKRYGVTFNFRRSHGNRILELVYIPIGDSSDGKILMQVASDSTDPRNCENPESTLSEYSDSNNTGDDKLQNGDSNVVTPPAPLTQNTGI